MFSLFSIVRRPLRAVAVAVVMVVIYLITGNSWISGAKSVIQIDFTMDPKAFVGLPVLVDGEEVGNLYRWRSHCKSGFEVDVGEHDVMIVHPEHPSEEIHLASCPGGKTVVLRLDWGSVLDEHGDYETGLVLENYSGNPRPRLSRKSNARPDW